MSPSPIAFVLHGLATNLNHTALVPAIPSVTFHEAHKLEQDESIGHDARSACMVQGCFAMWPSRSVDVSAVLNKLFC
jgi:hypothetical protein